MIRLAVFAILVGLASLAQAAAPGIEEFEVVVGSQKDVLPPGYHGLQAFPDQTISIISRSPLRYLLVGIEGTVLMRGSGIKDAVPEKLVLTYGPTGSFDDGYAGIGSVVRSGDTLVAAYHAERHVGEIHAPKERACNPKPNYWSIGLAVSNDEGVTFTKKGQILTSRTPLGQCQRDAYGVGDASFCPHPDGKFLYAYYSYVTGTPATESNPSGDHDGICVARCLIRDATEPGGWKKYFEGGFTEPGLGGKESLLFERPFQFAGTLQPHVIYIKHMKVFLMLCVGISPLEAYSKEPPKQSGIYWSVSSDGVTWAKPKLLWLGRTVNWDGWEFIGHPTLLLNQDSEQEARGSVVYCYTPRFGAGRSDREMHHMVMRPITITRRAKTTPASERPKQNTHGTSWDQPRSGSISEPTKGGLSDRLRGTKWINTNNVMFEWTNDGRLLHRGNERQWKPSGDDRVEVVFGKDHVDVIVFDESLKTFKQLIKGGPSSMNGRRVDQ
jgi:hypothetical protein